MTINAPRAEGAAALGPAAAAAAAAAAAHAGQTMVMVPQPVVAAAPAGVPRQIKEQSIGAPRSLCVWCVRAAFRSLRWFWRLRTRASLRVWVARASLLRVACRCTPPRLRPCGSPKSQRASEISIWRKLGQTLGLRASKRHFGGRDRP